jgi:hypothetical protein
MSRPLLTEEAVRQRLAINVRARRLAAGLTLKKASERGEMSWRNWQKIEGCEANATLYTVVRMAEALGVDSAELLREP